MKPFTIILFIIFLKIGCRPTPCEYIVKTYQKLPVECLEMVPYKNGQVVKLQHSSGYVISFDVQRETTEYHESCRECCEDRSYEINTANLFPNYSIFDIQLGISPIDSVNCGFNVYVGKYQFWMYTNMENSEFFQKADSIVINEKVYYDVFKFKSGVGYGYNNDSIYTDSLFYNYKFGILQIKMSNGENYTIYN